MYPDLTERQAEVYEAIREITAAGLRPTFRLLAEWIGFAGHTGVTCHMKALEKKGYVKRIKAGTFGYYVPVERGIPTIWGLVL